MWLMVSQFYIFFLSKSGKALYLKHYREVGKSVENLKART
ncbi:unknow [Vibrio campbellii]|nr:unknow [Vibrio campbellii]